jgi:hypothetical protein
MSNAIKRINNLELKKIFYFSGTLCFIKQLEDKILGATERQLFLFRFR